MGWMLWGSLLKLSRVGREESLVKLGQPCPQVWLPDIVLYNPSDNHCIALYNRDPQNSAVPTAPVYPILGPVRTPDLQSSI